MRTAVPVITPAVARVQLKRDLVNARAGNEVGFREMKP